MILIYIITDAPTEPDSAPTDSTADSTEHTVYMQQRSSVGATENAGQENDGQKCSTQNALIDH